MKKIALVLALVMVFACALVACDNENTESVPANESTPVTESTPADESKSADESVPADESENVSAEVSAEDSSEPAEGESSLLSVGKTYTYTDENLYYITWGEEWAVSKNAAACLTDGVTVGESVYYGDATLVGWNGVEPVITIDLGEVKAVDGIKYYAYAGMDGIALPTAVKVEVSEDGNTWTELSCTSVNGETTPSNVSWAADGYLMDVTVSASEAVNGKFVKVSFVKEGTFVFLTELEVYGK